MRKKNTLPSVRRRLLRSLACGFGAALLAASSARAAVTIGYDSMVDGNIGFDLSLAHVVFYVPFTFDLGSPYTLDSIQVPFLGNSYTNAGIFLVVTPTLGTDLSLPKDFTPLSIAATSPLSGTATTFTFRPDSPTVFTSGATYYLRIAYVATGELFWVSRENLNGDPPANGSGPNTSGGPSGGPSGDPGVTLTPLMTLNPNGLTFRIAGNSSYSDQQGTYQLSITASAVPEPTISALAVGGITLGAGLLFRLRRRN